MFALVYILPLLYTNVLAGVVLQDHSDEGPLILTPYIEKGGTEKAKHLSAVDPSLFAGVNSHAGYFTVNKTHYWNLFFWYFPAQVPSEDAPLLVWLQGGPGGSSLFGLFYEIGPFRTDGNTVEKRPIHWGIDYSLIFIDNPVHTGFSFSNGSDYATDEDMIGAALLSFMQQFLEVFPELRRAPLFLSGESYAGKYIPAFGHYIHNNQDKSKPINLKGLAIGSGWTDPPTMLHYSEFSLQVGLLDQLQADELHQMEEEARKHWKEGNFQEYAKLSEKMAPYLQKTAEVNVYNYLASLKLAPPNNEITIFLNKPQVQSALHVKKMEYKMLNNNVYMYLYDDLYKTVKPWLEELLEHYAVMCYNGQLDVIVAYALSVHTHRSLKWSGADGYLNARRVPVYDAKNENIAFYVKTNGSFVDAMVRGAGHMVPADQPEAAKQMIDWFINKYK
ncbi:probable serine carboxypeptidase CPVL [Trichoplusia ni]|uniref:Carboxypeptidase n=1 Tax=Trichoplusia ni TaxID=7111 RepID=A0A7E5WQQ1_TRINI|nr:probable serine carboxypeptidase CPVL [Trichoplusia ni]